MSFVVVAVLTAVAVWYAVVLAPRGPFHPGRNPVGGYTIEVSLAGDEFVGVVAGAEGNGCERLGPNNDADRTCRIATALLPSLIGGEAYGELNTRHTPAFDALVWRARADADKTVCGRGGLEVDFLARCESDAIQIDYEYTRSDLRVRVPIGGAIPSSST